MFKEWNFIRITIEVYGDSLVIVIIHWESEFLSVPWKSIKQLSKCKVQ